jgi:hypothetical protein
MKNLKSILLASAAALVALSFAPQLLAETSHPAHEAHAAAASSPEVQADRALRDLWVGHVFWVRNVVMASVGHNKAAAAAAEQEVVANAKAIAAAIEPFYGKAASDKLFSLLAGHYGAVKQYMEATLARSAAGQDKALQAVTANADEIARFLSGANPNLPYDAVLGMLAAHGGHHVAQIKQLSAHQYAEEAQTWEAMKGHMYALADTLTGALAAQFPARFAVAAR